VSKSPSAATLPDKIVDVEQLEDLLSDPPPYVVATMRRLEGDVVVLGVGGKMGPSLARMIKRADFAAARLSSPKSGLARRVFGVSRFTSTQLPDRLRGWGIEPIPCDLLDRTQIANLPDAPNVVFMPGMKFGSTGQEARTWAMNAYLPGLVCERYKGSRIVAFSTGNVYGLTPVAAAGGSVETDEPRPLGEYAMSCLARERMFEHFSRDSDQPMALIRLNYAVEMRYGVLVDMARKVFAGEAVELSMGHFNCIWQGDANAQALAAFDHLSSPPNVLNVTGPETLSVRGVCEDFGRLFGKAPRFARVEAENALLSNSEKASKLFGSPRVGVPRMIAWIADWVSRGGESLGKPTHFESRDGKF
jgi:nucleoside-diphosphate-sugar epimerase